MNTSIRFDLYSPQELRDQIDIEIKKVGDAKQAAYNAIVFLNNLYGVQDMSKANELNTGIKVEKEHIPTMKYIKDSMGKYHKMATTENIARHIAEDHLDEMSDYYTRLLEMEKIAEDDKKRPAIEIEVIKFLLKNPNPPDSKIHAFADKKKISPHKLEAVFYKLATERASMSKDMQKATKNLTRLIKKQITDKTGRVTTVYVKPEGSKTEWLNKFMNFFSFKSTAEVNQRIEQDYKKLELDKKGVTWSDWKSHVSEYFNNKDKWDRFFNGSSAEKKATEKKAEEKAKKAEKKPVKQSFKLSLMKMVATLYGTAPEKKEEPVKTVEKPVENNFETMPETDKLKGRTVSVNHVYGSLVPGLSAKVTKEWTDPSGTKWVELDLGVNQGGQKLKGRIPVDSIYAPTQKEIKADKSKGLKNFTIVDNNNPSRVIQIKAKDINEAKDKGASELKTHNIRTYEHKDLDVPNNFDTMPDTEKKAESNKIGTMVEKFEKYFQDFKNSLKKKNPEKDERLIESLAIIELKKLNNKAIGSEAQKDEFTVFIMEKQADYDKKYMGKKEILPDPIQAIADKAKEPIITEVTPDGYGPAESETSQKKAEDVKIVEAIQTVTPENRADAEAQASNEQKQEWAMTYKEYRDYLMNYRNESVINNLKKQIASRERVLAESGKTEYEYELHRDRKKRFENELMKYIEGRIDEFLNPNPTWDYIDRQYQSLTNKDSDEGKALKRKLSIRENKAKKEHERLIKNAIKSGNIIPANVLKEYPEIQKDDATKMTIPDINYKPEVYEKDVFVGADEKESNKRKITINDYSKVPPKDVYLSDEENILKVPRPSYIPEMDLRDFAGARDNKQNFDVVRLGPNKYIIVDKRYPVIKAGSNERKEFDNRSTYTVYESKPVSDADRLAFNENAIGKRKYYEMNAETLAATWDYYRKMITATEKQKNEDKQDREEKYYNEQKKKALDAGKNWPYAPFKRKGIRPTKAKVDAMSMTYSQAFMIQDFTGIKAPVSEFTGATKMNADLFNNYQAMLKELEYKINDLRIQGQYNNDSSTYKKGQETAYGDSGTKTDIFESKGVLVKRQNGTEIDDQDIAKIGMMVDDLYSVFGDRTSMNKKYGLKISYAGDKRMHASKAIGMFVPEMKCIAISNSSIEGRGFTVAHEYAHFMDAYLGESSGYNFLSDEDGSIANDIASTFRKDMRLKVKPNEKSAAGEEYYNRTCECFARAMEQFYAIKQGTENILYEERNKNGSYIDHDKFLTKVMPLCERFLVEKNEMLKAFNKGFDKGRNVYIKKTNPITGKPEYRKVK